MVCLICQSSWQFRGVRRNPGAASGSKSLKRRTGVTARAQDLDVQIFRFTLGIPGFDDANIPRLVGFVGGALLTANHLISVSPVPDAQARGEAIGACLVLLLIVLPWIETELLQLGTSQGRKAAAKEVPGASSVFVYNSANEDVAKNLAWVSFASLRNSNTSSLLVVWKGEVQLARGAFAAAGVNLKDKDAALQSFQSTFSADLRDTKLLQGLPGEGKYMPNRQAMRSQGLLEWGCVAEGIESALLLPLGNSASSGSFMLVLSEFERSLGIRDRAWLQSLRDKVFQTCQALV